MRWTIVWVGVVSLSVVSLSACGGDDRRTPADGSVVGRDGTVGRDGAVPDGPLPDGAAVPDAGLLCIPPEEIPEPIPEGLVIGASCPLTDACGGDPEGRTHELRSACVSRTVLFPGLASTCSAATLRPASQMIAGSVSFEGGIMTREVSISADALITLPNACGHGCRCTDLEGPLRSAGFAGVSCNPVCAGGDCTCSVSGSYTASESDTYTVSGSTITTGGGETFELCVAEGSVALEDGAGTFTFADAIEPIETCDGTDDDGDGTIDEAPRDCAPPCGSAGVCAEGVSPVCGGSAGWVCRGSSPSFEGVELSCDALDNDCDDAVDESFTCGGAGCGPAGGWIWFTESLGDGAVEIRRIRVNGADMATVLNEPAGPFFDIVVVPEQTAMYWVDSGDGTIRAASWDGMRPQDIASARPMRGKNGLDVSPDGLVYWGDVGLLRLDLTDPAGMPEVVVEGVQPSNVLLDLESGHVWWSEGFDDTIHRMNLDGSGDTIVLDSPGENPRGMALDRTGGKLYYATTGSVVRVNVDGTSPEVLHRATLPDDVRLDVAGNRMYWSQLDTTPTPSEYSIWTAALDGSGAIPIYTTTGSVFGIDLVFCP